jgi:predicted Zn finger-like uncharacterized protein
MNIKCPNCGAGIRIDESKYAPGSNLRVTCPKCREVLSVGLPGLASAAPVSAPLPAFTPHAAPVPSPEPVKSCSHLTLVFQGKKFTFSYNAYVFVDGKQILGNYNGYTGAFSMNDGFRIQIPIRSSNIVISVFAYDVDNYKYNTSYSLNLDTRYDYEMLLTFNGIKDVFSDQYVLTKI